MDLLFVAAGGAAIYTVTRWLQRIKSNKAQSKKVGKHGQPLKLVVAQCEARWFLQDLKLAMSGDCEAMVRVSHMLMAGYGTAQDHAAAAHWMRQAWAIQNYKEPALLHDMLDVRESDIPALNDAKSTAHNVVHSAQTGSSSSNTSSSTASSNSNAGGNSAAAAGSNSRQAVKQMPQAPAAEATAAAACHSSSMSSELNQAHSHKQLAQQQQPPCQAAEHTLQHCSLASQQQQAQQQQGPLQPVNKQMNRLRRYVQLNRLQMHRQHLAATAAAAAAGDTLTVGHASSTAAAAATRTAQHT